MARYKPVDRNPKFIPVVVSEPLQPGTFEFTLNHLIDHALDFSALDARFKNDQTGATAYDPRVMMKIVLWVAPVLITSDRMGLIGKALFTFDCVKLPSNASKDRV